MASIVKMDKLNCQHVMIFPVMQFGLIPAHLLKGKGIYLCAEWILRHWKDSWIPDLRSIQGRLFDHGCKKSTVTSSVSRPFLIPFINRSTSAVLSFKLGGAILSFIVFIHGFVLSVFPMILLFRLSKTNRGPWAWTRGWMSLNSCNYEQHVVEAFSSVPRLPAWSFLRLIHGGFLPPPHSHDKSWAAVSPADKSWKARWPPTSHSEKTPKPHFIY